MQHLYNFSPDVTSARLGFVGGGFVKAKLASIFGMQLELLYMMKGGSSTQKVEKDTVITGPTTVTETLTMKHKLQNVEVPLLFKFYAPGFETTEPNLFIGPHYSRVMDYENTCTSTLLESSGSVGVGSLCTEEAQAWTVIQENAMGVTLGLGVDFSMGTFDLRYSIGTTKVLEGGGDEWRTGTVAVMLGFTFTAN